VKIWNTDVSTAAFTIPTKANVCCVKFNPSSSHCLAFGSADHHVHYYDVRHDREPLQVFKGHGKAVSYVRFLNNDELVSASTDSTLKLWNVHTGECVRTFSGKGRKRAGVMVIPDQGREREREK
jgi:E3 ubiquitin-protein ligase RFWD2